MNENSKKIQGSIVALVTPFRDGKVDEPAYEHLIERQIAAGTHGLVPVGTTGESATLSHEEHRDAVAMCCEIAKGRVPVIAGAGSNATREALELVKFVTDVGADAILAVTGYYNKPSQPGLIAHFEALSGATQLPIILYNVPGRTIADLSVETVDTLARIPNIVGIKDATGDLARVARQRKLSGEHFIQLSGEDITAVGFNAMGGSGCISVTANIAPALCAEMQNSCLQGDYARAREIQNQLTPLHDALFSDVSPAPAKYALSRLGLCAEELRLPLVRANQDARYAVDKALDELALVE